jgi:hypothetical protein
VNASPLARSWDLTVPSLFTSMVSVNVSDLSLKDKAILKSTAHDLAGALVFGYGMQ